MMITPESLRALADDMGSRHPDEAAVACRAAADQIDAARYRFLAECQDGDIFMENPGKDALDAAIDAMMQPGEGK